MTAIDAVMSQTRERFSFCMFLLDLKVSVLSSGGVLGGGKAPNQTSGLTAIPLPLSAIRNLTQLYGFTPFKVPMGGARFHGHALSEVGSR